MKMLLPRTEIQELRDPQRISGLMTDLLILGQRLDYRCGYHTVRGLLELSAAARRCKDLVQAAKIINQAHELTNDFKLGLLEVGLLIEQAALAIGQEDPHTALSRVMQAENLVKKNGYELRRKAITDIYDAIGRIE